MRYFSETISSDLEAVLLSYNNQVSIRNELDFYGASQVLAEYVGLKKTPKSFSSWSHGVHFHDLKYVEQVIWTTGWVKYRLVENRRVESFLKKNGIKKVRAIGLPIVYVPSQNISRLDKSVLIMLAHSLSYVQFDHKLEDVIKFCQKLKKQGRYVCFCIHLDCALQNKITKELDENGIDWFVGSSVNDANSLKRMRRIFEYFEVVASNTIGSHFFYAQLFGAKFFFLEPYFEYETKHFKDNPRLKKDSKIITHGLLESSQEIIMKKFPDYFMAYEKAICDQGLAESACGVSSKVEPNEIVRLLGWGRVDQLSSPLSYYSEKVTHKLIRTFSRRTL